MTILGKDVFDWSELKALLERMGLTTIEWEANGGKVVIKDEPMTDADEPNIVITHEEPRDKCSATLLGMRCNRFAGHKGDHLYPRPEDVE